MKSSGGATRNSGIGMHTQAPVHHGTAADICGKRQTTLDEATSGTPASPAVPAH